MSLFLDGILGLGADAQCLPSLLPGSISPSHYDVSFPSDAHPDGYFVCKWRLGQYMSRVIDCWTNRTAPTSSGGSAPSLRVE